jgi:aspartate/methionine/tyrosine aminotransferase
VSDSPEPRLARTVAGRGVTLIRRIFDGAPAGAINLGLGQSTDAIPEPAWEAARRALESRKVPYSPTAGLPALRAAVGERLHGGAAPESVLVTAGSQQALWTVLMGLVDPGEEVIFAEPGYPAYRVVTEMIGAKPVAVPLSFDDEWALQPEAVEEAWTERTRAVIVASPANPTGMDAGDDASLARLHELCERNEAWLICDEIYSGLSFRRRHGRLSALGSRAISISGISKTFAGTGLRVGWLKADPQVVQGLLPLHQQVALCASTIGQHAAIACLELWSEGFLEDLRALYEPRRQAAVAGLSAIAGLRFHEPDGAFYVFADFSQHAEDTFALAMRLRNDHQVLTAPGESFGAAGKGWLRISFATEPEQVREGLERIKAALA